MRALPLVLFAGFLASLGCAEQTPDADQAPSDTTTNATDEVTAGAPGETISVEGQLYEPTPGFDPYGFFLPDEAVGAGSLVLDHVMTAGAEEFEADAAGTGEFPPIHFEFHDTAAGRVTSEDGYESWRVTRRVTPDAYRMRPGEIAFAGRDTVLGEVRFRGRLDGDALSVAQAEGMGPDRPILVGDLQVGDRTYEDVGFTWTVGD